MTKAKGQGQHDPKESGQLVQDITCGGLSAQKNAVRLPAEQVFAFQKKSASSGRTKPLQHIAPSNQPTLAPTPAPNTPLPEGPADFSKLNARIAQLEGQLATWSVKWAAREALLERRICEQSQELQNSADEFEQLTYIATHDLKVPLNNLNRLGLMLCESEETLTSEHLEHVHWIMTCTEQLNTKVDGLLQVSQIRLGQRPPDSVIDLRTAVTETIAAFMPMAGQGGPSVHMNVAEGTTVHMAREELDQILTSVLDNAVKYADPARALQVSFASGAQDGRAWLSISDNGTGVETPRDVAKVFGLFQRAHKHPAGRGLSLYCAQRLLQRCGGEMSVTGLSGLGAQFTIHFPKEDAKT